MTLEEIFDLLRSSNYKDRVKGEYYLIKEKHDNLCKMIIMREAGTLDFEPNLSMNQWKKQAKWMKKYLQQLEIAAEYEDILL